MYRLHAKRHFLIEKSEKEVDNQGSCLRFYSWTSLPKWQVWCNGSFNFLEPDEVTKLVHYFCWESRSLRFFPIRLVIYLSFPQNCFRLIHWIQWIEKKPEVVFLPETHHISQCGIQYITILLNMVVKKKYLLLSLVWYLFNAVGGFRYLTKGSSRNALSITTTVNVFVAR